MTAGTDALIQAFRLWVTDNVPASGANWPNKQEIIAGLTRLAVDIGAAQAGLHTEPTIAARDTYYATPENQKNLVYVNNNNGSATDPANGVYEYVGGAARLAQGFYAGVTSVVRPLVDEAEAAAALSVAQATAISAAALLTFFKVSGFINSSGNVDSTSQPGVWVSTDFLDVSLFRPADIYLYGDPAVRSVQFYTEGLASISGVSAASAGAFVSAYPAVPGNAKFVRFSAHIPLTGQRFVPVLQPVKYIDSVPDAGLVSDGNLFSLLKNRSYLGSTTPPVVQQDGNWLSSDPIKVTPGYQISYDAYCSNNVAAIVYYDLSGVFAGRVLGTVANARNTLLSTVPGAASYNGSISGTTLTVPTGSMVNIGSVITGAGVAANTIVTGGSGTTYTVNNSQTVASTTLTQPAAASARFSAGNPTALGAAATSPTMPNTIRYAPAAGAAAAPAGEIGAANYWPYLTQTGFVNNSGANQGSDSNWLRSDFIAVRPGRFLQIDAVGTGAMNLVSFYDASFTYIPTGSLAGTNTNQRTTTVITVPASAAWMKICGGNIDRSGGALGYAQAAFPSTFKYHLSSPPVRTPVVAASETGLLIPDSRSSTQYPTNTAAWARRLGCTVIARGQPGATVQTTAADAYISTVTANANVRFIVINPGGNDNGGTVGTFSASSPNGVNGEGVVSVPARPFAATPTGLTFIQYVYIMTAKLIDFYKDVRTRAGITGGDSEAVKSAKLAAVQKTMFAFITDLPQQRANSSDPFSLPVNWEKKRQAIIEVAKLLKVPFVDFQGQYPIDMSLEPFYVGPTTPGINNGNLYEDGLHPNEVLQQLVVDYVVGQRGGS